MKPFSAWALLVLLWAPAAGAQTVLTTLAGRGGTGGCPAFDIPPGGSTFFVDPVTTPIGVAVDATGKLFVSMGTNCIFRLDADGILRLGFPDSGPFRIGTGTAGFSDAAPSFDASQAQISNPQHLALDGSGNLYFADTSNHVIRRVDTVHWTISTVAGGGSLRPIDGIPATSASFLFPTSVAVDQLGNLYIVDSNAAKVFKVDTNGVLTRFAGSGGFTYNGEGITAISAGMIPMDVEVDASGDVFIADWSNSIVRKVTPDGLINTVAGNPFNVTGLGDGGPAAFGGILAKPRGIALDSAGDLFIADTEHHRIRMVDASGIITTVAGDGTPGSTATQLNFPYDVAADTLGNIFVADTVNNELRGIIVSQRTYALTLATTGTGSGTLSGAGVYTVGNVIPVSETPAPGSTFVGWSGPNAAACATGFVVMDADKSCTATFAAAADTTPPVFSGVPASSGVTTSDASGAVVTYTLPTATDPDDAAGPVTCTPASGSRFLPGTTTVTCTSTDTHGNTGSASFTITVALVPVMIAVNETITVADDATLLDAVIIVVNESVTVADASTVTVPDTTPPVFAGIPASLTAEATGPSGAVVTYPLPTASDPDDAAGPVACTPASGSTFPFGTTKVLCQSTDSHGNVGSAVFTVTVVDTAPPTISIVTPVNGAIYQLGRAVTAQYSCADTGSGIATCQGTVPNGSAVSTASVGPQTFVVNASDVAGHTATASVGYAVSYQVCPLYDPNKAKKSGSTYPIQVQLCAANGQNVSSSSIVVHAVGVTQLSTNAFGTLDDAGNSNPDFDFRYDAASSSYIFNLRTTGLTTGTYALGFTAGADPVMHAAPFQIK